MNVQAAIWVGYLLIGGMFAALAAHAGREPGDRTTPSVAAAGLLTMLAWPVLVLWLALGALADRVEKRAASKPKGERPQ